MEGFAINPTILPAVSERKGSLYLRSDHMKYGRTTLNSNWHADREAEPKDYDVCAPGVERNLLKATYTRIGNIDGTLPETTTQEAMSEVHKLKTDFHTRDTVQTMVTYDNFHHCTVKRETGRPEKGYGSVLPTHRPEHGMRHLETTQRVDYQSPNGWTPKPKEPTQEEGMETKCYHHQRSEFTDTADHRRPGHNTWQDSPGPNRDYHLPHPL